jgi:thioredoxin reductase
VKKRVNIAIIGGGITGATTALYLSHMAYMEKEVAKEKTFHYFETLKEKEITQRAKLFCKDRAYPTDLAYRSVPEA